ncbi:hypothetical protein M3Y98_00931100 [Aphelenchoides besseyi]|nr:hypothetical protein M3Y98_00931100 [Aphelenchoides besseyi]KAI6194242.1 hypothetical protein M3Y96_01104200 [Aphelenchoides besseyi]
MCQKTLQVRVAETEDHTMKPAKRTGALNYERDDIFAAKNPVDLTIFGKLEYDMIGAVVNVLECSLLFFAVIRALLSVMTPNSQKLHSVYWLFIILPLSILFTRAEATDELDD